MLPLLKHLKELQKNSINNPLISLDQKNHQIIHCTMENKDFIGRSTKFIPSLITALEFAIAFIKTPEIYNLHGKEILKTIEKTLEIK